MNLLLSCRWTQLSVGHWIDSTMKKTPVSNMTSAANSGFICIAVAVRRNLVINCVLIHVKIFYSAVLFCTTLFRILPLLVWFIDFVMFRCFKIDCSFGWFYFFCPQRGFTRPKLPQPKHGKPYSKSLNLHPSLWVYPCHFSETLVFVYKLLLKHQYIKI